MILLFLLAASLCSLETEWEEFKAKYGKIYDKEEDAYRMSVFAENLQDINRLNKLDGYAIYGINKFSDLTDDEMSKYHAISSSEYNTHFGNKGDFQCARPDNSDVILDLKDKFDWTEEEGMEFIVRDQKDCNAGWAYATVAAAEALFAQKEGKFMQYSVQRLIECDTLNNGCNGGDPTMAERYMKKKGLLLEKDWEHFKCITNEDYVKKISNYSTICQGSDDASTENYMRQYLFSKGPLVVTINSKKLKSYEKGIITGEECSKKAINHVVLAVGYNVESEDDEDKHYWRMLNSWGPDWGENGFFRIAFGNNVCGLASGASFVE